MISLKVPGVGCFNWTHLVLDINGTLSLDGVLLPVVAERLHELSSLLSVHLATADTRGTAEGIAGRLGVDWIKVERGCEAEQKRHYVESLGAERVVAIGNGNNDVAMLSVASLGVVVLEGEGSAVRAIMEADIVTRDIRDALDLLLKPTRLLSTLRC